MSGHDPLCPVTEWEPIKVPCDCELIARVRADERADLRAKVEADRADLNTKIAQGPEVHDWEQIDQWACERVALNRVLALLSKEANDD